MWIARYLTAWEVDLVNFLHAHFLSFLFFFSLFHPIPFCLFRQCPLYSQQDGLSRSFLSSRGGTWNSKLSQLDELFQIWERGLSYSVPIYPECLSLFPQTCAGPCSQDLCSTFFFLLKIYFYKCTVTCVWSRVINGLPEDTIVELFLSLSLYKGSREWALSPGHPTLFNSLQKLSSSPFLLLPSFLPSPTLPERSHTDLELLILLLPPPKW